MLGLGVDTWDSILLGSLAIAAFAAVSIGLSSWASSKLHKQETQEAKADLERYKLTVAGQVAEATAKGIEAGRTAGDANMKAAQANERAAALEKEAADANARTAEVMKAAAWRQLDQEQANAIFSVLSKRTGKVRLLWVANDPESFGLVTQLAKLFEAAKWEVLPSSNTYPTQLLWGIWIPNIEKDADTTRLLREALSAAKMKVFTNDLPTAALAVGNPEANSMTDVAAILVGSKQPSIGRPPN